MNNIYKNLLLALTFACVIGLVVFFIMLIVINSGVEPPQPAITVTSGHDDSAEGDAENGTSAIGDGFGSEDFTFDGGQLGNTDLNDGLLLDDEEEYPEHHDMIVPNTRHTLIVGEGATLVIYSNSEFFDFQSGAFDWSFDYIGYLEPGFATLDINVTIRSNQGLETDAISFLQSHTGFTVESYGEVEIANSGLFGYHVNTHIESGSYEAWVYDLDDSEFILVFVISYTSDSHRDALYAMLSTMFFA